MTVATGVSMNKLQHILPFTPIPTSSISTYYQESLSVKGKQKLKAYQIYKLGKLTIENIADIFGNDKSTISRWITQVEKALDIRRYQSLEPKSTRPFKKPRHKVITPEIATLILTTRDKYKCGKENISKYLDRDYDIHIHSSTVGRYLKGLRQVDDPKWRDRHKVRTKRKKNLIRIKDVVKGLEKRAFERFQIDTKHWVINSITFYVVVAIDTITRMMFARIYSRHTANCARDFLQRLDYLFDIKNTKAYIQRDNGSEFMGDFECLAEEYNIELITNFIRRPQMNGFVERMNRTIKEELLEYEMPSTVKEANEYLHGYIIKYNFERMHSGINDLTPFERACELKFKKPFEDLLNSTYSLLHLYRTFTKKCI
jgi:putative transposase